MLIVPIASGRLVNLDGVEMVFTDNDVYEGGGCRVIAKGASGESMMLGWYKDELRAQAVLREILEAYKAPAVSVVYEMPRE